MALVNTPGGFYVPIGVLGGIRTSETPGGVNSFAIDAVNEAVHYLGFFITEDGNPHTIDTSGLSSLRWRTGTVTFANAGTTVRVGLAPIDLANGPPGRAANTANVIDFDVYADLIGGGGGITANAWQTHTPTNGSKLVASGDLIVFAVQMRARGGTDLIQASSDSALAFEHFPATTTFTASYASASQMPTCEVVFSDGARGWFFGTEVKVTTTPRTWNSGSVTKEYGQLFQLPFPVRVFGIYGSVDPDNDFEAVLYSDPLGTPVAERTVAIDRNTVRAGTGFRFSCLFPTPYDVAANAPVGAVLKPGAANISTYFNTLNHADDRKSYTFGTNGYGISRASGAFNNANNSLDQYYVGIVVGGFDAGGGGGGGGGGTRAFVGLG
jgi:hypothetical protein